MLRPAEDPAEGLGKVQLGQLVERVLFMIALHVSLEGISSIQPIHVMALRVHHVDVITMGQVRGRVRCVSGHGRQLVLHML